MTRPTLKSLFLAAAPLALAALLGTAPGASADVGHGTNGMSPNGLSKNALQPNALHPNGLAATGAALDDLDGVRVEAVTLPGDAR